MSVERSSKKTSSSINFKGLDYKEEKDDLKPNTKKKNIKNIQNIIQKCNKSKNSLKQKEFIRNDPNKLLQSKTTKDNTLNSVKSINNNKYDKFVNKKIQKTSVEEIKNDTEPEINEIEMDKNFLKKLLYNHNIKVRNKIYSNINENNSLNMSNYKIEDNEVKFNDLRKYIIKIEKKMKDEEDILKTKSLNEFMEQLENLIARFSFIIYIFIINKEKQKAKDIFLLMMKENIKYIDYVEKNIVEQYYLSKDIPIEAYKLLKIYSFIIKYCQLFNISNYCNIFLGRYFEIIYFIYNLFIYEGNYRGFTSNTKNQINSWFSLVLNNASYYAILYYHPINLSININNNIIKIYQNSDENTLTKIEKTLLLKVLYNLSLFYYLNGQIDKALIKLNETKERIINSDEFYYSINNLTNKNRKRKDSIIYSNSNDNALLSNEDEGNRLSTATSISEFVKNKSYYDNDYSNKLNEIEKLNQTFTKSKIDLNDISLLMNYGFENGLINENNNSKTIRKNSVAGTNYSNKFRLYKKLSIPKYYKNPLLFKLELLHGEIEIDKKNYTSAYEHILKAFYILVLLKYNNTNKEENLSFTNEQQTLEKYLSLIEKLKEKEKEKDNEIDNTEEKSENESSENISNQSSINNNDYSNKKFKEESEEITLDKYNLYLEWNKDKLKEKEKKEKEILYCNKKDVDYKMFQDIEKFFIFLCSLSLNQITILNESQPEKTKRNDLPIYFSSQFKDCLSKNQRIELDNLQVMALNRSIILKNINDWIMPNNLNIGLVNKKAMEKYIKKKTYKFINKFYGENENDSQMKQTKEYKIYKKIITSRKINKESKEFIKKNCELVLKVLKKANDNEIEEIIKSPSIIIKPVHIYKKKRKSSFDKNNSKSYNYFFNNINNYSFANKNMNFRMSMSGGGIFKSKIRLEKNLDLKKESIKNDYDDHIQRLSCKKDKRKYSKLGENLIYHYYDDKYLKTDKRDYNDNYKEFQISIDSSIINNY